MKVLWCYPFIPCRDFPQRTSSAILPRSVQWLDVDAAAAGDLRRIPCAVGDARLACCARALDLVPDTINHGIITTGRDLAGQLVRHRLWHGVEPFEQRGLQILP